MRCIRIQFGAVCILISQNISRKRDHGHLHAEADSEEWDLVLSRIVGCQNHSLGSSGTKTARNNDSVHTGKGVIEDLRS